MWSSGIILYALLCGCLPFDGNSARLLIMQIRDCIRLPDKLSFQAKELVRDILIEDSSVRMKVKEILKHAFLSNSLVVI